MAAAVKHLHQMSEGIWIRTHFRTEGHMMHATAYVVAKGEPEVLRLSVDLREIARFVARYHNRLHGKVAGDDVEIGFLGGIGKFVKKIGKSKLISGVYKGVKSIAKSKLVGGAIAVTAVAFPPVGLPAAAAYATANAALAATERASRVKETVTRMVSGNKRFAKVAAKLRSLPAPAQKAALQKSPQLRPYLRASLAAKLATRKFVRAGGATKVKKAVAQGNVAAKELARIVANAQSKDARVRLDARKSAAILRIVAENRAKLAAVAAGAKGGLPGLLIDPTGRIVRGKFVRNSTGRALLYGGATNQPGTFAKVGAWS